MKLKLTLFSALFCLFSLAQSSNFQKHDQEGFWLRPNQTITEEIFKIDYKSILGLNSNNQVFEIERLNDDIGMTHIKFQQYYKNVPVEGAVIIVHLKNGIISSINGKWIKDISLSTVPSVSKKQAIESAKESVPAKRYYWEIPEMEQMLKEKNRDVNATFTPKPELVLASEFFTPNNGDYALSYKMEIYAEGEHNHKTVFINATDGSFYFDIDGCHEGAANGAAVTRYSGPQLITTDSLAPNVFRLQDTTRGNGIHVLNANNSNNLANAIEFIDSNNYWNNANSQMNDAATDAFWGLEMTYDYFDQKHGRKSYDDNDGSILAYVHVGNGWFNATWNGQFIQFGDGNNNPLTSIDVASHELSHGVTQYTAGLIYSYESGALNESFSDIFGNAVEFFGQATGASWLIGKANFVLRDMADPKGYGQPDTYKGPLWEFGSIDNGGVHINSGVQNYWFYLLSEGGTGTNDNGDNYGVAKIGIDTAAAIAYRNLAYYLVPGSNFYDARQGAIMSAVDLYGNCSNEVEQVIKAWHAVGIGPDTFSDDFESIEATGLTSGCALSAAETLSYAVKFNPSGCTSKIIAGDSLYFNYRINNNVVTEGHVLTGIPSTGDTISHTFNTTADFSQTGIYTLDYWVSYVHDNVLYNDSITGIEIKNTTPLNDTLNKMDFESLTEYNSHTYVVAGEQGLAERKPGSASNNSLFGMRLTATNVDPDNIDMPTDPADNFNKNPQYGASICMCVDATNWNKVALTFDAKQTFSEMYKNLPQVGMDIPEFASSLRITINGNPEGVQLHPLTYKSDPYYTHQLNLDFYAGKIFTACFEGRHFIPVWDDFIPGSPGDNSYLDNIIFEDKSVINIKEESLAEYKIFPNPADEIVFVQTKNIEGRISIVNSLGQELMNNQISLNSPSVQFDLSTIEAGIYFIQIENNGQRFVQKLVIL